MNYKIKCTICNKYFDEHKICSHYKESHNLLIKEAREILNSTNTTHLCKCCGKPVKFKRDSSGYKKFCNQSCAGKYEALKSAKLYKSGDTQKIKEREERRIKTLQETVGKRKELGNWRENPIYKRVKPLKEVGKAISNALKKSWEKKSQEEIDNIVSKRKVTLKNTYNNKSIDEKIRLMKIRHPYQEINEEAYRILLDKDRFLEKIKSLEYPSYANLSNDMGVSTGSISYYINLYDLKDYILYSKSHFEQNIYDWIKTIYKKEIIHSERSILDGSEIDLYIPEFKLGLEFNGVYYHSIKFKDEFYHQNKSIKCYDKGINLIHIYENEWVDNQDNIKSYILSFFIP